MVQIFELDGWCQLLINGFQLMLFRGFVENSDWKNEKLVPSYCQKYLHSLFFKNH